MEDRMPKSVRPSVDDYVWCFSFRSSQYCHCDSQNIGFWLGAWIHVRQQRIASWLSVKLSRIRFSCPLTRRKTNHVFDCHTANLGCHVLGCPNSYAKKGEDQSQFCGEMQKSEERKYWKWPTTVIIAMIKSMIDDSIKSSRQMSQKVGSSIG
jgi:hypothetical protein